MRFACHHGKDGLVLRALGEHGLDTRRGGQGEYFKTLRVVRDGPKGCWVGRANALEHVPGFKVQAVDSNGAGDAHAGVFIAGLANGLNALDAARRANAAAALAVTHWGPATSPGTAEVDALLSG
jgi:sugar/nucleoside kinase (ribokinase family)